MCIMQSFGKHLYQGVNAQEFSSVELNEPNQSNNCGIHFSRNVCLGGQVVHSLNLILHSCLSFLLNFSKQDSIQYFLCLCHIMDAITVNSFTGAASKLLYLFSHEQHTEYLL